MLKKLVVSYYRFNELILSNCKLNEMLEKSGIFPCINAFFFIDISLQKCKAKIKLYCDKTVYKSYLPTNFLVQRLNSQRQV